MSIDDGSAVAAVTYKIGSTEEYVGKIGRNFRRRRIRLWQTPRRHRGTEQRLRESRGAMCARDSRND